MRLAPWLEPLIALAAETGSTVACIGRARAL
jgi:hypothetical protein